MSQEVGPKVPRATSALINWHHKSEAFSTLFNYHILRAGHLRTSPGFRVSRESVVGHELILCLRGKGYVRLERKLYEVGEGELAWLPVRRPHEHYPDKRSPWELFWIRIDGEKLNNLMHTLNIGQNPVFHLEHPQRVTEVYRRIFALTPNPTLGADAYRDMLCAQLMTALIENRSAELPKTPQGLTHKGLERLICEVQNHCGDDWNIEKFARCGAVSKSQLFRLFSAVFHQSPLRWLKEYRISQARRLLLESEESVGRIAEQVGYNDPLHFSRDFHCLVGTSPSNFRKRGKSDCPPPV